MTETPAPFDLYADILGHAARRPEAVAVHDGERAVSYARFARDIELVTRQLHSMALPPERRAAIHVRDSYLHWLIVIALWRLGNCSVSVDNLGIPGILDFFRAGILITDTPVRNSGNFYVVQTGVETLAAELDEFAPLPARARAPDHPVRLSLSSGTTGEPKKIIFTRRVIDARLARVKSNPRMDKSVCFMSLVNVASVEYFFSIAVWSAGGAVDLSGADLVQALIARTLKANMLFMNTRQLSQLVDRLPPERKADWSLTVIVGGSVVPREVYEKARQRFTRMLAVVYGSTEAGTIALMPDPLDKPARGVCGYVVRDMEVQVLGGDGAVLPRGKQEGELRIRSSSCVDAYADDPAATAAVFRDGWFYPGDTGSLSDAGLLTIAGRIDELMNLGSHKLAPEPVEEALAACPGVLDLAAFAVAHEDGLDRLWVAIVADESYAREHLSALWKTHFGALTEPNAVLLKAIPRNPMGKVLRQELRAMVAGRLGTLSGQRAS